MPSDAFQVSPFRAPDAIATAIAKTIACRPLLFFSIA